MRSAPGKGEARKRSRTGDAVGGRVTRRGPPVQARKPKRESRPRHYSCAVSGSRQVGSIHKGSSLPDEEIIMLGLYEWLHEEIELENAARREENAS